MKIEELVKRVKKINQCYVDMEDLCEELKISHNFYVDDDNFSDLKMYPIFEWLCTDTLVGYYMLFLKNKAICIMTQEARKSDKVYRFLSIDDAERTKEYILENIKEEELSFNLWKGDFPNTFQLEYSWLVTQLHENAIYKNEEVKVLTHTGVSCLASDDNCTINIITKDGEKTVYVRDLEFKPFLNEET